MSQVQNILQRVRAGERMTEADAVYLYHNADLLELGSAANEVNRSKNGDDVYYNVNRHINPTNVCAMSCKFCAFSRKPGQEGAYEYSIEDMVARAQTAVEAGATEVHMVGGLHPRWRFSHYLEIISAIKQAHPSLHIKAFTAVEIDWLAAKARLSIEDTLTKLREAGLDSMPGGGAEIFHADVRDIICDTKTDAERWMNIHRLAHRVGLRSNCTMLYGHIERVEHRVDHMARLRQLQDETRGFNVFIPLAFQPFDNEMGINRYTMGTDDLRTIAIARLFLDNFDHIKAYWIMLGQDIAQLALNFGANDLDGTVTEEKISRMAGGRAGMAMDKKQIHSLIRKANKIPVERDTLYHSVWRDPDENQWFADKEKQAAASMLLYRIEQGEQLTSSQAELLADYGNLFQLGHCATLIRDRLGNSAPGEIPMSLPMPTPEELRAPEQYLRRLDLKVRPDSKVLLAVDLANPMLAQADLTADQLTDFLNKFAFAFKQPVEIQVDGVKSIWAVARRSNLEISQFIRILSDASVKTIGSSLFENETDLTHGEIVDFHRTCHQYDIQTRAKVELSADYSGIKHPFWEQCIKRTEALVALQDETKGIAALQVEVAKDSKVTPTEYFRALALTRILARNIASVAAPIEKVPTIKPRAESYTNANLDPILKVAPVVRYFGADTVGPIEESNELRETLQQEFSLADLVFEPKTAQPVAN